MRSSRRSPSSRSPTTASSASSTRRTLRRPNAAARIEALLALIEVAGIDPQHRQPTDPPNDAALGARIRAGNWKLTASLPYMSIRSRSTIFTDADGV